MIRKILLFLLFALIVIQFIPINKEIPADIASSDHFYAVNQVPGDVQNIMDNACMDCHSYQTTYPWYTAIAPVKFFIQDHITEGREHLNFATWASYSDKKADHKLEECIEEMEEGEMPLEGYVLLHSEADLSKADQKKLMSYFQSLRR
jgi:hypothetical protein